MQHLGQITFGPVPGTDVTIFFVNLGQMTSVLVISFMDQFWYYAQKHCVCSDIWI